MYCPPSIEIVGEQLNPEQARFWDIVYTKGLGEFFYRNTVDFRGLIRFPSELRPAQQPLPSAGQAGRILVPWGGGKDSAVTAELLKAAGMPFDLFSFGEHRLQMRMAERSGKRLLTLIHTPDPKLAARTEDGSVLSGHIPYTATYTFASVLMALLGEYQWIAFSNERSANIGNVEYLGLTINHQWSKSGEFELMARNYINTFITPDIHVFSLLRPLSEVEIIKRFAKLPQYFDIFSSCNGNFFGEGLRLGRTKTYWCGRCAKCAFVFAGLAAYLPKEVVVGIVGCDMYADESLVPLFSALLGIDSFKPFECVGTPDEMIVAMHHAQESHSYDAEPIMSFFGGRVADRDFAALERAAHSAGDVSNIPKEFRRLLI